MKIRRVQPEILDTLPAHHPDAIRCRRDLRIINALMGNHRWLRRQIQRHLRPGDRILEIGAGDGTFSRSLVQHRLARAEQLLALDLHPAPAEWPDGAAWRQQDLFAQPLPDAEIVIANLFLHHFEEPRLAELGANLSPKTRVLLICEPQRWRRYVWGGWLLHYFVRLNRVTRHDMPISIKAGFCGSELADALHLQDWQKQQTHSFFGAHRIVAEREPA